MFTSLLDIGFFPRIKWKTACFLAAVSSTNKDNTRNTAISAEALPVALFLVGEKEGRILGVFFFFFFFCFFNRGLFIQIAKITLRMYSASLDTDFTPPVWKLTPGMKPLTFLVWAP